MIQFVVNDWLMSRNTSDCSKYSFGSQNRDENIHTKGTVYVKTNFRKVRQWNFIGNLRKMNDYRMYKI